MEVNPWKIQERTISRSYVGGFLENSINECNFDNNVHMNDVMRDLATNVAGKNM